MTIQKVSNALIEERIGAAISEASQSPVFNLKDWVAIKDMIPTDHNVMNVGEQVRIAYKIQKAALHHPALTPKNRQIIEDHEDQEGILTYGAAERERTREAELEHEFHVIEREKLDDSWNRGKSALLLKLRRA